MNVIQTPAQTGQLFTVTLVRYIFQVPWLVYYVVVSSNFSYISVLLLLNRD